MVIASPLIVFNDNGGWCWYQDERVIVQDGKIIIGSVANYAGTNGDSRSGDIEVTIYEIATGKSEVTTLHDNFEGDDHDSPAFQVLSGGNILVIYTKHHLDNLIYSRIIPNTSEIQNWNTNVTLKRGSSTTYSNVFYLCSENSGKGCIYNFYRGENFNPNFIKSDDNGITWSNGGWLIRKDKERPYIKYASNNVDKIFFAVSDGHPREYYNHGHGGTNIYLGYLYNGGVYKVDDKKIRNISMTDAVAPEELTRIYTGNLTHRAWPVDFHLDENENPYLIFSSQVSWDGNFDGSDLRYYYARWKDSQCFVYPLAYAGSALYNGESDYSGLAALNPQDPNIVYISTNADPISGAPLISNVYGTRHYEIFKGITMDGGETWTWQAITKNSIQDNIRPIVPIMDSSNSVLLWMRGSYSNYKKYNMQIVGMFDPELIAVTPAWSNWTRGIPRFWRL